MGNLIFYRDKKEKLTCELLVEGVELSKTQLRLCLEFPNGDNHFYKGKLIKENGEWAINIPPLVDIKDDVCNVVIEVIADTTYFKVFEDTGNIKTAVNVKLNTESIKETIVTEVEDNKPKIKFSLKTYDEDDEKSSKDDIEQEILEQLNTKEYKLKKKVSNKKDDLLTFNDFRKKTI
jgi:hypothetical protein